ncbi:hypothetical protein M0P98_04045 [bacterium]|nr:hypothetical protein [bacterium]
MIKQQNFKEEYNVLCIYKSGEYSFEGFPCVGSKFCLKDVMGNEIPDSFISITQIEYMRLKRGFRSYIEIRVFTSPITAYTAFLYCRNRRVLNNIALAISLRGRLKRNFLKNEWFGEPYNR